VRPIETYKCYTHKCDNVPTHWYWPQAWRQSLPSCNEHGSRDRRGKPDIKKLTVTTEC
jgi:hypothetical protein